MKKHSQFFNKQSRLFKSPEIQPTNEKLDSFKASELKNKLSSLLQIQNDFFPCFDWQFPPPILSKSSAPHTAEELFSKISVIPNQYSIYLHIPFCKTYCNFCYYPVMPGKAIAESPSYVNYLVREMEMYSKSISSAVCESIYLGGGTPTFLNNAQLEQVFAALKKNFNLADNAEITIEAAPGTLPRDKIELLKKLGVTRLSYGIQTLDEKLLANMNRFYSVSDAIEELKNALEIIGNVNVDTMYGFDGEPEDALLKTLNTFYEMGIPSLSIYSLDKQRSDQKVLYSAPKDEMYQKKIEQFNKATEFLFSKGYKTVLQNVYVLPEQSSYLHQTRRWDNLSLVALGVGSQGFASKTPYQNYLGLKQYKEAIDSGRIPVSSVDHLSAEMELCRELTSKLRFTWIDTEEIRKKYNVSIETIFGDLITALSELGYLNHENNILKLTPMAAYYNNIIPMLFSPDAFKEELLGLPEEYLEEFPVPYVMTKVGQTQSTTISIDESIQSACNSERRERRERRHLNSPRQQIYTGKFIDRRSGVERRVAC